MENKESEIINDICKDLKFCKTYNSVISSWVKNIDELKKNKPSLETLTKYHKEIEKYIENNKYYSMNTKKIHLVVLLKLLKEAKNDGYDALKKKVKDYKDDITHGEKDNELSNNEKDKWMNLDEIVNMRKKLKNIWNTDVKTMFQYLLLSLYTLQPPLRQDWKDVLITDKYDDKIKDYNYIFKDDDGQYILVINNDKVSSTYGPINLRLNEKLSKIIDNTLKYFPRKYILSLFNDGNKPMGKQMFEKLLKSINGNLTVDIIRSAYISDAYSKNLTMNQKEDLANKMRHSVGIAETSYNKIFNDKKPDVIPPKKINNGLIVDIPLSKQKSKI